MTLFRIGGVCAAVIALAICGGCSIKKMAVNRIGDALASGGPVYESDPDMELVGSALPFGLKLIESLLAESPRHKGLLISACQGFATYSYLYVHHEADRLADQDLDAAERLRARARRLYLRAQRYGFRALEAAYPGVAARMMMEPAAALASVRRKTDVPMLYWNAVALGLAISVSKSDAAMLARLPEVEALVDRALTLDEAWNEGALHEFEVIFAGARPGKPDFDRIGRHFDRAAALAQGKRAGLYVAWAESVAAPKQDRAGFRAALEKALAIDPEKYEDMRLQNTAARRRAEWLLERTDDLILSPKEAK
ncbi:MAG: TRAP transporter TatT component family protein [Bryobacteraceae bacterium]